MREFIFDTALIVFGTTITLAAAWLLTHLSDRRVLRRVRPWSYSLQKNMTHEDIVAQRSLTVAFAAVILLVIGVVCLMSGFLRAFGFGR